VHKPLTLRIRTTVLLALAHAGLSASLLALDALALRGLPAASVHLNMHPPVARSPWLFVLLPLLWLAVAPSLPDRKLRVGCTLMLAGCSSNLLAASLFGGVPDYLVFRHGIGFAARTPWQSGHAVFNAGDVAIALGLCWLLLLALLANGSRAQTPTVQEDQGSTRRVSGRTRTAARRSLPITRTRVPAAPEGAL
jgi:Signal peptidase (SPase) II